MQKRSAVKPWEALQLFPPCYCRLFAKRTRQEPGPVALTHEDIAKESGLSVDRVREISQAVSWEHFTVGEVLTFFSACRFDPTDAASRRRAYQYEFVSTKRGVKPFAYLRNSPKWESQFLPIIRIISQLRVTGRTFLMPNLLRKQHASPESMKPSFNTPAKQIHG